jgi:hypothetical protein
MNRILSNKVKHGCAILNGSTGFISGSVELANISYTIEFYMKANADVSGDHFLTVGDAQSPGKIIHVGFRNNTIYYGHYSSDLSTTIDPTEKTKWHHYTFVYNHADQKKSIYLDGVHLVTSGSGLPYSGNNKLFIGKYVSSFANISIDEVRIWNYARTATQIQENYTKSLQRESGLVAYYKLDGNALDNSGNGNNGTVSGGVTWSVDGKVDAVTKVCKFDSTSSFIDCNKPISGTPTEFCFEGWFNTSTAPKGASNVEYLVYCKDNSYNAGPTGVGYLLYISSTGVHFASATEVTATYNMIDGKWHHLAVTFKGGVITIYANGKEIQRVTNQAFASNITSKTTLGSTFLNPTYRPYAGKMGIIRLWDKAPTQQDIQDNMFKILPASTIGLLEQWVLNGDTIGTKGNNGIATNNVTFVNDIPELKADVSTNLEKAKLLGAKFRTALYGNGSQANKITGVLSNSTPRMVNPPAITVGCQVKLEQHTSNQQLFSTRAATIYYYGGATGLRVIVTFVDGSVDKYYTIDTKEIAQWTSFVLVIDSQGFRLYKNNVLFDSVINTSGIAACPVNVFDSPYQVLELASDSLSTGRYLIKGGISDYVWFDRALSLNEIYRYHAGNIPSDPVQHIDFKGDLKNKASTGSAYDFSTTSTAPVITYVKEIRKALSSKSKQPFVLKLDGINQYAQTGYKLPVIGNGAYCMEAWVRLPSANLSGHILVFRDGSTDSVGLRIFDGKIGIIQNGNTNAYSATVLPVNQWVHIAFSRTPTDAYYYINGVQDTASIAAAFQQNVDVDATGAIGATFANGIPSSLLNGEIGIIRVWNKHRDATEIRESMFLTSPKNSSGLLNQWTPRVDGIYDLFNNKITLLSNPQLLPSTAPVGQRSNFEVKWNTNNNGFTVPHASVFNNLTSFTIVAWVRLGNSTGPFNILSKVTSIGGFSLNRNGSNIRAFVWSDSGVQRGPSYPQAEFIGKWTCFAYSYNETTREIILSANGVVLTSLILASSSQYVPDNSTPIEIGTGGFNGTLGRIQLYNTVIPLTDIQKNMYKYLPANTPNLVEQWKLNEGVGGIAYGDKGNNGTITGTATWTTPSLMNWRNKVARVNGGSVIPTKPSDTFNMSSGTFELWAKSSIAYPNDVEGVTRHRSFVRIENGSDYSFYFQWHGDSTARTIWAEIKDTVGTRIGSGINNVDLSNWTHLAVTFDVNGYKFYVNGVLSGSRSVTIVPNKISNPYVLVANHSITGGAGNTSGFNGLIDEVRVWNVARTATEIVDNMYRSISRHPNLMLNYTFDNSLAWDSSGYGNHGIVIGTVTSEESDNDKLLFNAPILDPI